MSENESVTIFDVASLAGVSPSTVSRVMRNGKNVKQDTVIKVREAAERLNYSREHSWANGIKNKELYIAMIIPDLQDPFFVNSLKGLLDQAKLYNSHVITYSSNNSSIQDKEIYANIEKIDHIHGVVIIPSGNEEKYYKEIAESKIPTIFLDRIPKDVACSSVTTDDYDGAFQATKHLLALGHANLIYFGGNSKLSTEKNRLKGFIGALQSVGLEAKQDQIIESDFNFDSAYMKAKELLLQDISFTAVFAANDLIAMGMKKALEEKGLDVPEDISLVGYGDMPFARYFSLSSVSSPSYELGKTAFNLLYGIIKEQITEQQNIVLRPSLIIRDTSITPK